MAHTLSSLLVHVVFSTKDRESMLDADVRPKMMRYLAGIARKENATVLAIGGMADHVHVFVEIRPSMSVADLVRTLKANASRWIRQTGPKYAKFAWQSGYAVFSVSRSNVAAVSTYVQNQGKHHAKRSFQDELLALLKKHGVEFDERYIWD